MHRQQFGEPERKSTSGARDIVDPATISDWTQRALTAQDPAEILRLFQSVGVPWMCWQIWEPESVRSWDMMPKGFLAHYYGINADRFCAVAVGIRRRWSPYTFQEARQEPQTTPYADEAETVWTSFGIRDGAIIASGRGTSYSMTALATPEPIGPIFSAYRASFILAAARLDEMLRSVPLLPVMSRKFHNLSPKQLAVLRIQIDHPELSFSEQARLLEISPRMLEKRHKQIAEKYGVTSFTAAIAKAVASGHGLG